MPDYKSLRLKVLYGRERRNKSAIVPNEYKRLILAAQGGKCFYCDVPFIKVPDTYNCGYVGYVMDHLFPRTHGGRHFAANRVASCSECDGKKGGRLPTQKERVKKYEHNKIMGI